MAETIANWYRWGFWTAEMVMDAVPALITKEEAEKIISEKQETN